MKIFRIVLLICAIVALYNVALADTEYKTVIEKDKNGFEYESVTNDPMKTRIYTLKNGLKVYLTKNTDTPRIFTAIVVKAGSKFDPPETTGLAHYLEHIMFKGTSKIGTNNWEKEKPLLDKIAELFEKHKDEKDEAKKKKIYEEIDKVSQEAAKYAIPNEYSKMAESIGTTQTNAFTSNEQTVYLNEIPSNEIEKWTILERERFNEVTTRLFHSELETVYEEYNKGLDNDGSKMQKAMMELLFKKHPYGTQTTIGKAEHLKNPSIVNIKNYFNKYYVANNMAIVMSGDFDYDETIKIINKNWQDFRENKDLKEPKFEQEAEITKHETKEVYGPTAPKMALAYRFKGYNSNDRAMVILIDSLLNNTGAGLIDLDLLQKQKVLRAYSYQYFLRDYGMFVMGGVPQKNQKLEEITALLLGEIEKLKNGEFDEWLVEAVINDFRKNVVKGLESNNNRVDNFTQIFTNSIKLEDDLRLIDEMSKIKKSDVVKFAKEHFKDNYIVINKRAGQDKSIAKIEKPKLTPVDINREEESIFFTNFQNLKEEAIKPVFVDFDKAITKKKIDDNIELYYIKNESNELFSYSYIYDIGKNDDKKLALAVKYAPYIGTTTYNPEELHKEYYKLGINLDININEEKTFVSINGLQKNFEKGIGLLEHVMTSVKSDKGIYAMLLDSIVKERIDSRMDKKNILWGGMVSYAKYGEKSPFTDILSLTDLSKVEPEELTNKIKTLASYKHKIFYYGPETIEKVLETINKNHKKQSKYIEYPAKVNYEEKMMDKPQVYFVNYDMQQVEAVFLAKDSKYSKEMILPSTIYDQFYGEGLNSIVFQEVREAKGLAYSVFSNYILPSTMNKSNYVQFYIGTQADKLNEALSSIYGLAKEMPKADRLFDYSRQAALQRIESSRIIKDNIFWEYLSNQDLGIKNDYREDLYEGLQKIDIKYMQNFFDEHIKKNNYTLLVIGNKKYINLKSLEKYGTVKELQLDDIYGY